MTTQRKTMTASSEIKPRITITTKDYENLSLLARAATTGLPLGPRFRTHSPLTAAAAPPN